VSSTVLYVLNQKSVSPFASFKNSAGTGPAAYDNILEKYMGPDLPDVFERGNHIDALIAGKRVDALEMFALLFLSERSYVPIDKLFMAGEMCEEFGGRIPRHITRPHYINHWPSIGQSLKEMAAANLSRHAVGACLTSTTVCDEWQNSKGLSANAWPILKSDKTTEYST
jgi:hypothetical protein